MDDLETPTLVEKFCEDPENLKLMRLEGVLTDVTETLACTMKRKKMSKKRLAELSGLTAKEITRFLDGGHDMKVADAFRLFYALGYRAQVCYRDLRFLDV